MSEFNDCPNLEIVRKQLKQYIINQPPVPDCEINYELGYMYDPLYEIKDWYCNYYDIGDKYYYTELHNHMHDIQMNSRLSFNVYCRGYVYDPWNVEKNVDIRGKPIIRPGCTLKELRMFYDYKECCRNKDWKTFADKYTKRVDYYFQIHSTKTITNIDRIDEDILTKQIQNYYQLDVMTELLKKPRRKTIIDETITCNCNFGKFSGFRFNTFKITNEFDSDYCYGIYGDPMYPFRYEFDVVRDQIDVRFKNIFENHPIDAEFCFELYIWLLRHSSTKIGLSDVPNDSYLSKF